MRRSLGSPKRESVRPIIMYELNEVPWEIIDYYIKENKKSCIAKVLRKSKCYTTLTVDNGELHPWVTWPTLHRGVANDVHKIEFLNQSLSDAASYPPIWDTAAKAGLKVGVFGSLQSYPVPQDTGYAFYVPDTFAPSPEAFPHAYVPLQELNLQRTAADGGTVSDVDLSAGAVALILRLLKIGLSARTIGRILLQILRERWDSDFKTRRSVFQAPICFDVFKKALKDSGPDFCTFFTNHVAGMMHRYWSHAFAERAKHEVGFKEDRVRRNNIRFAMDIADEQISYLKGYVDAMGGTLLVVSSMGQEAIRRNERDQARVTDIRRFVNQIGFKKSFRQHLAMHPDFNFEFDSEEDALEFAACLRERAYADGRALAYKINVSERTLNFGLAQPPERQDQDFVIGLCNERDSKETSFADAGLIRFKRDIGTAYHQPRGIAIWYDPHSVPDDSRAEIDSRKIRPMVLKYLGVSAN